MTREPNAEAVYRAAELFVDRVLRRDDSLFTEGVPVWSLDVLSDLDDRFIQSPDESEAKFELKFEKQLTGAPARTIQLAAEVLFVHLLVADRADMGGKRKRELVEQALSWSPQPVALPADLALVLDAGLAKVGAAFMINRHAHLYYLIHFAAHWKRLPQAEREAALADPWRFKSVAYAVNAPGAPGQREALLHLVFPDEFESIVAGNDKKAICAAFPEAPGAATDVDQRLAEIRTHLTAKSGRFVEFYDPQLRALWRKTNDRKLPAADRVWWVNQGQTYAEELAGGYLWAPKANEKGRTMEAWTNMERVRVGDVIVHYAKGVRALSCVTKEWETANRPSELQRHPWENEGYRVLAHYEELAAPVPLDDLPPEVRRPSQGPFDVNGDVMQRYLVEVPSDMGQALAEFFADRWPGGDVVTGGGDQVERHPIYDSIASKGFSFPEWLVTDYLLSLGTKPFVLLSGISGTGKTKMAQLVAEYLAPPEVGSEPEGEAPSADPGSFVHRVGRSTLRYGFVVPLQDSGIFPDLDVSKSIVCRVEAPGFSGSARYYPEGFVTAKQAQNPTVRWRLPEREWINRAAAKGDYLMVTPEYDGELVVHLRVIKAHRRSVATASSRTAFISVRADWTDNCSMLGYYNPLTEQYVPTELLRLLLHALTHPDAPHFAILDEMNLAKVEYYFSDFLSAMESGTEMALHDAGEAVSAEIQGQELPIPERVRVPANLLFTGTVNVDETAFMFSPKVLDRANVLQFHTVDLERYGAARDIVASRDGFVLTGAVDLEELLRTAPARRDDYVRLSSASRACLVTTNAILAQYHLHFGYRVANEIARYLGLVARYLGEAAVPRALDLQIQQKILPKFVGNRAKLERPLWELLLYLQTGVRDGLPLTAMALDGLEPQEGAFPGSVAALQHMLQTLRQVGFASFIE